MTPQDASPNLIPVSRFFRWRQVIFCDSTICLSQKEWMRQIRKRARQSAWRGDHREARRQRKASGRTARTAFTAARNVCARGVDVPLHQLKGAASFCPKVRLLFRHAEIGERA